MRLLARDPRVARERELGPAAETRAVDRGDRGTGERRETADAASGVRIPPPTMSGIPIASWTARISRSGTGSGAPLPASK